MHFSQCALLNIHVATDLEDIASARLNALKERKNLGVIHLADMKVSHSHCIGGQADLTCQPQPDDGRIVELIEGRKNWRLCVDDPDDEISDELIVRVQGVMSMNNLVPRNARR